MNTILTEEQINHLLYETKKNILLTGPPGVGKTTLLREFIEATSNVIVCASTGSAASFINGETMHKSFSIPVPSLGATTNKITPSKIKELILADTVVIDEISMCRVDNFAFAMKVLKKAEKQKGKKIRIIVSGDFSQLPPVVPKEDEKLLRKFGFEKSGYPFTCKEWKACNFTTIELTDVKRQSDKEFIDNLHKVRLADKKCIPYFNSFVKSVDELPTDCIHICGTNAEADRVNNEYLNSLEGLPVAYRAHKSGTIGKMVADEIILLKNGASVYFNANDNIKGLFSNGTFGEIVECLSESVMVKVKDEVIEVKYQKYPSYSYKVNSNSLTKKEVGAVYQIPLRLAKGITIHKSQGKTFDRVIFTPKIFASGQLYVALSRVKSPEGLFLTEPIISDYLMMDLVVKKFYKNNYTWEVVAKAKALPKEKEKEEEKKPRSNKPKKPITKTSKATASTLKKTTITTKKKAPVKKTITKAKPSTAKAKTPTRVVKPKPKAIVSKPAVNKIATRKIK